MIKKRFFCLILIALAAVMISTVYADHSSQISGINPTQMPAPDPGQTQYQATQGSPAGSIDLNPVTPTTPASGPSNQQQPNNQQPSPQQPDHQQPNQQQPNNQQPSPQQPDHQQPNQQPPNNQQPNPQQPDHQQPNQQPPNNQQPGQGRPMPPGYHYPGYYSYHASTYAGNTGGSGSLSVSSNPEGASVYVDGSYSGTTPTQLSLDAGTHSILITLPGYNNYSTSVTITGGQTQSVQADLS